MTKQLKIYPIYVIAGQDVYLRAQAVGQLRAFLLGKDEGLGEVRFDGKSVDLITVLDEVRTLPFLADRKVVFVDDADKFITENRELLEKYFDAPNPQGVLVLVTDTWRKATKLDKKISPEQILAAESMKGQSLTSWVMGQVRQSGKEMSSACAQELISAVGSEAGRLSTEVEKLALYLGERKQITAADIQALTGHTAEESVFLITDLMAEGKAREVLTTLEQILDADRSAEYSMVGVLTFSIRRLLKAKTMLDSGIKQGEVLSACRVYPGMAPRFLSQLKRFTVERLKRLIDELAQVDYGNKTGLGQARMNLEKFILCATVSK
jgi:DNA polymerase III subunit delta